MSYRTSYYLGDPDAGFAPRIPDRGTDAKRLSRNSITLHPTPTVDDETHERILQRVALPLYGLEPIEALQISHRLSLKERLGELLRQLERRYELTRSTKDRLNRHFPVIRFQAAIVSKRTARCKRKRPFAL